nr:aminotransferase class V-fold PLP-dependent enzyme [Treponema sp. OMZ 798]
MWKNMIYLDNSATTLQKPESVAQEVFRGLASNKFGNPGRGAHSSAHAALTELFKTRQTLARLFNIKKTLNVAFCQNATSALNLVIKSLFLGKEKDTHIITTALEHNSVLRPLYQLEKEGAHLSVIPIEEGFLRYDLIEKEIEEHTKAIIVNHCSNVIGSICDLDRVHSICKKHGLIMIVDASQSAGTIPIDVSKYGQSIFCFTGHKGLYGPQGTGGIVVNGAFDFAPVFSGGSGVHSFDKAHPSEMPDIFEAGTMNVPSFMGLNAGASYVLKTGIDSIQKKLADLKLSFIEEIKNIPNIKIYGTPWSEKTGPVVGLNIGSIPSGEISRLLDEDYGIASRPGAHCAPLVHKALGTEEQGIVRFSFSSFNTFEEIKQAAEALKEIAGKS